MPISFNGNYGQNFDGLALSGTNNPWTNDGTLPGWHLFRQPSASPVAITSYNADTGAANNGNFLSYGSSGISDRGLGGLASGGAYFGSPASGSVAGWFALALSNATAAPITNLAIAFNGEQWRNGGNTTAQTMVLEYGYGASFDQVATWTAPGGNFNWASPVATATAAAVDGNNAGRAGNLGGTLNLGASPWAASTTLWLRWTENNDVGNDHGLAIDDLTITTAQPPALPEVAIQALDAVAGESGDGAGIRISRTGSTAAALEVPIILVAGPGLATAADLSGPFASSLTIPAGAASADLALSLLDDSLDEGTETLRIQIAAPAGTTLAASGASVDLTLVDNDRISLISAVQGSGATSPLLDQNVTLRAVVVADFQLSGELGGFFLQEETADWDTSALSSEGLYVAYPISGSNVDVKLGDRLLVSGVVSERFSQTILSSIQALTVEASGRLADTRRVDIPDLLAQRSTSLNLEPYEGMWVRFPETLSVNGLFGQFRFGEVELSAAGLPVQPTNVMEPGAAAYAAEQATALRELVLDDGSNSSYRPASAATAAAPVRDQLLRRGDTIDAVEGVLGYDFSKYRLHPTAPLAFASENPRPEAPAAAAAGQLRLASFNVLNTFTTLNSGGALTDSGLAPRGANTAEELERQLSKLTTALLGLKADVIGLMELENDADDATLKTIVDRLNGALPANSGRAYSFVPTGLIGSDAIKVGLIYNNLAVAANGAARVLDTAAFTDPLASGTPKNRPALAQTFRELASGETVNVVVNHLKSKGATDATGADLDQRDGQAAFNATRTAAAARLLEWIKTNPTGNGDPDWVVLGDLNAYAKEDPIQVFEAAGYRNALPSFTAEPPSSYAFFTPVDMSGALDHMLISPSLVPQATAALDWNINAAEGAFRDYNRDTNSNGNAAVRDFFSPDPYRTSDHDPVLLDLKLGRSLPSGLGFSHGVASGDPHADSVILWTRVTPPAGFAGLLDVRWEVSRSAGFEAGSIIDAGVFATSAARDWTVKVLADGLNADTTYYYRFRIGDVESMVGQTKTLPAGGNPVRLAVFSCTNFTAAEQFAAYGRAAAINAVNPYDALVHLGDYIYEYGPGGFGAAEDAATDRGFLPNREIISLDDYRRRYAQYHTDQNLQDLRAAAPLIAIWDDHETANDSWTGGAENHQPGTEGDWIARRDAALKAYHEWLPIRDPDQRQASDGATALSPLTQGYRSFNFGEVLSLHVLETRLTARDEQLEYPDAAAVQARIGAILTNPTELLAYAGKLGLTPPTTPQAIPAFGAAIAPAVTQELVLATVQKAWGDPSRDLIGDTQLAWLQNQMGQSKAAWQVLGQQVLMQSMAVPAELLLDAGNPALLDKYAAPLQKLATGTTFAELSAAEQALFAEAGKIPYNLDSWDGYGVERETILQTALALGKRLISLAGDTHNAWSGVLDTMSAGSKPAGAVAGVEFATPGVTSPGLEKYLPGADAYIRAKYPAVDGLDGLFSGYVNGLKYADLNRRGFLDLTVNKDQAIGTFQFLDGVNPLLDLPQWATETVVASGDFKLSVQPEATPQITWQSGWRELDLVFGMAVDINGGQRLLDPYTFATLPRSGVQLADVSVLGSQNTDRIFAGVGSLVDGAAGDDELFNIDSLGGNQLVGGLGSDQLFLQAANDRVIGGLLFSGAAALGLTPFSALVDRERDSFLIDSTDPSNSGSLEILDYEPGIDQLLIDGVAPTGDWAAVRQQLQGLNVAVNAAPQLSDTPVVISLKSGVEVTRDLSAFGLDVDGDALQLLKLSGPNWISTSGTVLKATVPVGLTEEQLASTPLLLGFSDGKAVSSFVAKLTLNGAPTALSFANTTPSLAENTSTASRIKVADIVIADDNLGSNVISLSGSDAASFEVVGTALFLKAGVVLDFEAKTSYDVTLSASDPSLPGSTPISAAFALAVSDLNEAPTALATSASSFAENIPAGSTVSILTTTDPDASNTFIYSLASGTGDSDNSAFAINGDKLNIKASPNFEAKSSYSLRLRSTDQGGLSVERAVTFAVIDLNEAPTALSLANTIPSLAENTSTASRTKVADIVIADDNLGSNVISLSGTDAASFEVVGTALFLKAGIVLDFEAKTSYAVKVRVADPALPDSNPLTSDYSLAIQDVNEVPGFKTVTTVVEVTLPNGSVKPITVSIDNAGFAPGTNLSVISDLGINPAGLTSLAKLGVKTNNSGLDFQLTVDQGASASLNALLDLVAADLVPQLTNPTGARRADRKLLYYAVNPTTGGGISPLTFDPITGAGARFFDLDNNGTADFFSLSLIDGGYGDKDGRVNRVIDDPSVGGFVDLTNLRFSNAGAGIVTIGDPTNAAPASVSLRATLSSRPISSNEIGYVVLNASEVPDSAALLADLTWLRGRARTLFSSLESTDVTLPAGSSFDRDIQLINGQSIRFFEVKDASLDQLTSLADSRFSLFTTGEFDNSQVAFSSSSGVRFSLNLLPNDPGLNALISQAQGLAPVLDLSAFTAAQSLSGTVAFGREADFNSVAGFYRTLDASGTVLGADSITRFRPGDSGYTAAALRTDNLIGQLGNLSIADNQSTSRSFSGVTGGTFLAPFAQVNGNTFFAFGGANTDRLSHFRSLGNNLFGLEDIVGGGDKDYDDMVIGFNFSNVA
ncbi:MAG: ExeM/NucH family extracellular endonuclease [Cyanobium sp. LacPavin_0920_WC12_MAG_63_22]|nr:ExeM/NucH family extracellular endonuclease [Cyanobium sp. LacPavin_0920_WC12_MAG_63_22]